MTAHDQADRTTSSAVPGVERRCLLRGAVAACLVGAGAVALSACATRPGGSGAATAHTAQGPVTVGKAADVPVGKGKVFADSGVVVTQPEAGDFRAFDAACTHQGVLVTKVDQGVISCPAHGSRFAITDGSVVRSPASQGLRALPVTVTDGNLVVG